MECRFLYDARGSRIYEEIGDKARLLYPFDSRFHIHPAFDEKCGLARIDTRC